MDLQFATLKRARKELLSWSVRGGGLCVQLVLMRALSQRMGIESYGYYSFLVSVIAFGTLLDYGLALAFQNHICQAKAHSIDSRPLYQNFSGLAVVLIPLTYISGKGILLLWASLGEVPNLGLSPDLPFIVAIFYGFSLVYQRTAYAEGHGEFVYISQFAANMLYLILIFALDGQSVISPLSLAVWYYTAMILCNISVALFKGGGKQMLIPRFNYKASCRLLKLARGFWLYALIGFLITQIDVLILGVAKEFTSLAYYTLMNKIFFGICYTFISVVLSLKQSVFSLMWERQQYSEIASSLKRILTVNLVMLFIFIVVFEPAREYIFPLFLGAVQAPSRSTEWIYIYYIYFALRVLSDTILVFFLAVSRVKIVNIISCIQALIAVLLQPLFFEKFQVGGVVALLTLSYFFSLLCYATYFIRIIRVNGSELIKEPTI